MKYGIPFPRLDKEREKASRTVSEVITYQASPEERAELTARMEKKRDEMEKERDREYMLSGSLGKKQIRQI